MLSKLSSCQVKIDYYKYKVFHVSLMVTPKEKPVVVTQKIIIKDQTIPLQKVLKSQKKTVR